MMISNQQPEMQSSEKIQDSTNFVPDSSSSSYAPSSTTVESATVKPLTEPVVPNSKTEAKAAEKGFNPTLSRALVGGLIGATLGTLAGALASKKTSNGVNHAVEGVGNAAKTVGSGFNLAARGIGEAAKSIGEGVGYAVVGSSVDTAKGIADGVKQVGSVTAEVAQSGTKSINQAIKGMANSVEASSEAANQSIVEATETSKAVADDIEASINNGLGEMQTEANPSPQTEFGDQTGFSSTEGYISSL